MIPDRAGNEQTPYDIPCMMDCFLNKQNYEIVSLDRDDDRCFIFFSSNGLYYPNDSATFHREIIRNNRFEWKKNIPQFANKAIFLRDLTKQLYFEGIDGDINTIEKLTDFLKEHTRNSRAICVGISGGGYAATLFGCLLHAYCVFNFAGVFSLDALLDIPCQREAYPVLVKYEKDEKFRDYFSLANLLKSSQTPVFYFYPARCEFDIGQSRFAEEIPSVYPFRFNTCNHPSTCWEPNFLDLFSREKEDLMDLQRRYRDTLISPLEFSFRTSGISRTLGFGGRCLLKRGGALLTRQGT